MMLLININDENHWQCFRETKTEFQPCWQFFNDAHDNNKILSDESFTGQKLFTADSITDQEIMTLHDETHTVYIGKEKTPFKLQ